MNTGLAGRVAGWMTLALGLSIGVLMEMQFAVIQSLSYETVMLFSIIVGTLYLAMLAYEYLDARVPVLA
jgi:hypothetical protein